MAWQQKVRFVKEPDMIQEVWIVFDCVTKPFTHGYTFFHVRLRKFLLYFAVYKWRSDLRTRLKDSREIPNRWGGHGRNISKIELCQMALNYQ